MSRESSEGWEKNFGLVIAFLVPGFIALWGVSYYSPVVRAWLDPAQDSPTLGTALLVSIASLAAGLTVSAARWVIVDKALHWLGVRDPGRDFSKLHEKRDTFNYIVEQHYRYYQYYANTLVAVLIAYVSTESAPWPTFASSRSSA